MSSDRIPDLLQECLLAYDAGLSPEECLSAFPARRRDLEPMLRQALSLRVAYASLPSDEFKRLARERLMFAAGRDARQAFVSEPSAAFRALARERLLTAAGASAQEALRNVPPPRLPFWLNARRRFLDAAAATPRPAFNPMMFAMRAGLTAAVVVIAAAIAGAAFLTSQSNPRSADAELAYLEEQLHQVELKTAAGQPVSTDLLVELTRRTNELAEKLDDQPATPISDKLPAIIERQKDVVSQAVIVDAEDTADLTQARAQLSQAEEKVRLIAARAETPAPTQTPDPGAAAAAAAPEKSPTAVPPTPTLAPPRALRPGEVEIRLVREDTTAGLAWVEIRTIDVRLVAPGNWKVDGIDADGPVARLDYDSISLAGDSVTVLADMSTGQLNAIVKGQSFLLRSGGANGETASAEDLLSKGSPYALELKHMADSVEKLVPPTPTATTTARPRATATVTPTATESNNSGADEDN